MVIEETKSSSVPTVLDLVISVEASQLVPGIRLCLAWLGADLTQGVLGQTGPGSEQLWHNLARMMSVLSPECRAGLETSPRVERLRAEGEDGPLWEDWLLARVVYQSGVRWERDVRPTVGRNCEEFIKSIKNIDN